MTTSRHGIDWADAGGDEPVEVECFKDWLAIGLKQWGHALPSSLLLAPFPETPSPPPPRRSRKSPPRAPGRHETGYISYEEAQAYTSMSRRHLERLVARGVLIAAKSGRRTLLDRAALDAYLKSRSGTGTSVPEPLRSRSGIGTRDQRLERYLARKYS